MGRCQHEPISLFDKPMPDDEKAAVQYFPSDDARRDWVIYRKCGRLLGRIRFCSSLAAVLSNHH